MKTQMINTVQDFKRLVGASDFSVTFRKANGQFRRADANIAEVGQFVKGTGSEEVTETREDKGIVIYFDRERNGIRSFSLESMRRLEVGGQVYQFGM